MNPRYAMLCGTAAVLLAAGCGRAPAGITATVTERVHPVLIRNDHNELLELLLDVRREDPVSLRSVTCRLDGTSDPGDLESLEMFGTGGKREFAPGAAFGTPARPAAEITFRGDQPLRAGPNVFWLSARLKADADLSRRVAAVCTAATTSAGRLVPQGSAAGIRRRIGVALRKHGDDGVHTYRIPALATSPQGTLLTVYDMRRRMSRDLQEDIDIGLSRSTDGGRTWEPPRVIMDMGEYGGLPQEQNGCSDPGIIVDQKTGEIFVFAVWMWGKPGKHQWNGDGSEPGFEIGKSAQLLMVRSRDGGLTWSRPENLTRTLKKREWWLLAPSPQQGINLPDGTLVMPVQGRDQKGVPFATIIVSRDHGAAWTVGTPAFSGGNECQAARLSDGSIMLNMRNDHERFRAVYVTGDLGRTWRAHETNRNTLMEPNCNASLYRVDRAGGGPVLLFANPRNQKGRTHHTIQVSLDDGRSWPDKLHLLLDEGRG
ncbi:MAG: exo-alpha-sialidase, partial [Bryobacterales bacterium]|nr:exo-alpha-sialidase [Bryobacterales bacterium]